MSVIERITTAEQLLQAPGLGRCELVRGELIMMSPAGCEHGLIVGQIHVLLGGFVKQHKLGRVMGAETGFLIGRNPDTVRAPDVAFVCKERMPAVPPTGFFPGAPDLAVEVLSPGDRAREVTSKVQDWLAAGCYAVWVVDPRARAVSVYRRGQEVATLGLSDTLTEEHLLPGFHVAVSEIFGP